MASEKTPNLGLNQIDRSSPKTTYFDLEKYLDQNWRAVDDFAGDVNDGVDALKKRLDTTERKSVTLEPGVQIVHAEKAAPFSLTGLSGRTLVNLLGRTGGFENTSTIGTYNGTYEQDFSNKSLGTTYGLKVTVTVSTGIGLSFIPSGSIKAGKYYVLVGEAKNGNAEGGIYIGWGGGYGGGDTQTITDKEKFTTVWKKFSPTQDFISGNIDFVVKGLRGQYGYFDSVRIYEISAAEYAALDGMTTERVATKYPYVDSVVPVRNPYAIRNGENLLPSFYEWTTHANMSITSPYALTLKGTAAFQAANTYIPIVTGRSYTISGDATGVLYMAFEDAAGNVVGGGNTTTQPLPLTFVAPNNSSRLRVTIDNGDTSTGTFTFSNLMLTIGSTAKTFKPREDSMLALQTDLYADPVTGANAETVFERDGQYFKTKKWRSLVLDGSLSWVIGDTSSAGLKQVKVVGLVSGAVAASGWATKYDGKIIPQGTTGSTLDTNAVTSKGDLYISISTADSGWGDGYTPTADEIKAYFMGWRMRNQTTLDPYDGTGVKAWGTVLSGGANNYTNTLPTTQATDYKTPYQLVYQLSTPTVEPIISEGQLTFNEGDNQVEVGTGIVLRERADAYIEIATAYGNRMNINNANFSAKLLSQKTIRLLGVYKLGVADKRWRLSTGFITSAGALAQLLYASDQDKQESYAITYITLEVSPAAQFTGTCAANEKTLLLDLVDSVQQNTARVSVLENKKAEKDNPSWIVPTLLNGWSNYSSILSQIGYYKDSEGLIHMKGVLKLGTLNTAMFILPPGYRPKLSRVLITAANTDTQTDVLGRVNINSNGSVTPLPINGISMMQNGWISLDSIPPFLAEQ
ncbi:hypothetical protein [Paenibacillus sp. NPDC055715]